MLNIKSLHLNNFLLQIILFITVSSVIIIGFYSWPIADDFCNFFNLRHESIYEFTSSAYHSWTGRIFTTSIIAAVLTFIPIELTNYVIVIETFMFIASVWFATSWLNNKETFIQFEKKYYFLMFFLIFYLLLTYSHVVGESLYWLTASIVYIIPLFLLTATKPFLECISTKIRYSTMRFFAIFIWFLCLGNSIELLVIPAIFMTFYLLYKISFPISERRKIYFSSIIGLFFGAGILIFSPGNYSRAASVHKEISFDFYSIIINFINMLKILATSLNKYFFIGVYPMILLIVGIISFSKIKKGNSLKAKALKINFFSALFFFCIAYLTYIPMIFALDFFAKRTLIYFFFFHTFSFIFLFKQFFLISNINEKKFILYFCIALFSLFFFKLSPQLYEARIARQNFFARHYYLLESKGNDVSVDKIVNPKKLSSLYTNDISVDQTHWINSCLSEYYGLSSIRLLDKNL